MAALFGRDVPLERLRCFLTARYGAFRDLVFHCLLTDLFWQHRVRSIPWLAELIRL